MKIQITFYPGVENKDLESGECSFATWQSKDMSLAMDMLFHIKPTERLLGITIGEDGIKAKIDIIK